MEHHWKRRIGMGSSIHRLEVLIIGLIVLLAGAVVTVMLALRPAAPPLYLAQLRSRSGLVRTEG
jgi:hypothetical protein